MSDSELVMDALWGSPDAFIAMHDRYCDEIHDLCWSYLRGRDAAAEAAHQTWLAVADRLWQLREPDGLHGWVRDVAHDQLGVAPERSPRSVLRELLWDDEACGLTDRDRRTLSLHLGDGLEGPQLAQAIGVRPERCDAVLSRLRFRVDGMLGALLVARVARAQCAGLDEQLQGWDGDMSPVMRWRISHHVEACDRCRARRDEISPWSLLAAVPVVFAPEPLREEVRRDLVAAAAERAAAPVSADPPDVASAPAHAGTEGSAGGGTEGSASGRTGVGVPVLTGRSRTVAALLVVAAVAGTAVLGGSDKAWVAAVRDEVRAVGGILTGNTGDAPEQDRVAESSVAPERSRPDAVTGRSGDIARGPVAAPGRIPFIVPPARRDTRPQDGTGQDGTAPQDDAGLSAPLDLAALPIPGVIASTLPGTPGSATTEPQPGAVALAPSATPGNANARRQRGLGSPPPAPAGDELPVDIPDIEVPAPSDVLAALPRNGRDLAAADAGAQPEARSQPGAAPDAGAAPERDVALVPDAAAAARTALPPAAAAVDALLPDEPRGNGAAAAAAPADARDADAGARAPADAPPADGPGPAAATRDRAAEPADQDGAADPAAQDAAADPADQDGAAGAAAQDGAADPAGQDGAASADAAPAAVETVDELSASRLHGLVTALLAPDPSADAEPEDRGADGDQAGSDRAVVPDADEGAGDPQGDGGERAAQDDGGDAGARDGAGGGDRDGRDGGNNGGDRHKTDGDRGKTDGARDGDGRDGARDTRDTRDGGGRDGARDRWDRHGGDRDGWDRGGWDRDGRDRDRRDGDRRSRDRDGRHGSVLSFFSRLVNWGR